MLMAIYEVVNGSVPKFPCADCQRLIVVEPTLTMLSTKY